MPRAVSNLGFFAVPGAFGRAATGVGAGGALPALCVAVAGHEPLVAVVGDPLLHPRHGCLPRDLKMLMSAQCPQTVPRRPAKVSERMRKLDVPLTWDFTLTSGAESR